MTPLPGDAGTTVTPLPPITYPRPCADLYDENLLPTFEVEIAQSEWAGMLRDCEDVVKEYRPIVFRYGTETVDAMMRLKGNWSWNCDKMQFVISFNETSSDGRFHGLRKIVLDAPWYDPTFLHERIAFFHMQQDGTPYSCVNNARLNINGEYYGLYANVERIDREYLERHFEDPGGNLFKGGEDLAMTLETNEDTSSLAAANAFAAATTVSELEALVDLPQAISVWSGLAMIPDPDSYWAGVEINFYLYEPPSGKLQFLPYDMDMAMAENVWPELVLADPITYEHDEWLREVQYRVVLSDTAWCQAYEAAMAQARAAYDVNLLVSKMDAWSAQIADAVAQDPNKTFTLQEHQDALDALRTFPGRRAAVVDSWLAQSGHCPPTWPATNRPRGG